jgi:hypothetical protein
MTSPRTVHTSVVKKYAAAIAPQWAARNVRHDIVHLRAISCRCHRKIGVRRHRHRHRTQTLSSEAVTGHGESTRWP